MAGCQEQGNQTIYSTKQSKETRDEGTELSTFFSLSLYLQSYMNIKVQKKKLYMKINSRTLKLLHQKNIRRHNNYIHGKQRKTL